MLSVRRRRAASPRGRPGDGVVATTEDWSPRKGKTGYGCCVYEGVERWPVVVSLNTGANQRLFHLLRALSRLSEITFVCPTEGAGGRPSSTP